MVAVLAALGAGACSSSSGSKTAAGDSTTASSTTAVAPATTSTTVAPTSSSAPSTTTTLAATGTGASTSTTVPSVPSGPAAPGAGVLVAGSGGLALARSPGGASVGRLQPGVAVSYDSTEDGWARVLSPCENRFWAKLADGQADRSAEVVIDPGHGGSEPGAVGPGGLTEKELNLDVARLTVEALRAEGISAALTRPFDYRVTIASRVAVAAALHPKAFVSIHHNAEPDVEMERPGSETFYQFNSAESKRLSGLVYDEIVKALSAFSAEWKGDRDAGAKYRLSDSGGDYYGILRRSGEAGLVASLAELGFISNPSEEALLQRDDVRQAEAGAVARALVRFLRSDDPGSGFTEPYPRAAPAGPGGGVTGCVDPLM